jgi:hypothetical protein
MATSKLMMDGQSLGNEHADSANRLNRIFHQSLAVLRETSNSHSNAGISCTTRRSLPIYLDETTLQKRALDDAAAALAKLWKVPESGRAKPLIRVLHPAR